MELTKEYFDEQLKNLVTKQDLDQRLENVATKDDLLELATKSHLGAVHSDIAEVKQLVQRIAEREDQDTRAVFRDIADLKKRVSVLERSSTNR